MNFEKNILEDSSDDTIFTEAARRLKRLYHTEHGNYPGYCSFEFVFEGGRFDGIDECHRSVFYQNPRRLTLVPKP